MNGEFCRLLLIFANSLGPDQAGHCVGPDLDPNCVDLLILTVFLKEYFKKVNFEKSQQLTKKIIKNYPACKELIL